MSDFADIDEDVLSALTARPAEEGPWVAVRRALDLLIEHYDANSEQTLRVAKVFIGTPVLVAFHRENLVRWARLLKPELARRMDADPDDPTDPRPATVIAAALACLDATLAAWAAANGAHPLAQFMESRDVRDRVTLARVVFAVPNSSTRNRPGKG